MSTDHSPLPKIEVHRLQALERELKARLRQQAAIASLGQLALTSGLQDLLDRTANMMVEILEVDFCKILELLPGGEKLFLRAGAGWKDGLVGTTLVSAGTESQSGFTLLSQAPVIVPDLRTETRFSGPPLLLEHGVISGMSVIIRGKERPFGVLGVHTSTPRQFTPDDINFLESAAGLLASAVERSRVEQALLFSRNQLSVILEGVADGITVQDRQGNLVYANETAAHLIGYNSAAELLSVPIREIMRKFELLDEEGSPYPPENLPGRQVMAGAAEASATVRFRQLPSGEERWSLVKARPVYSPTGEVELAVNIFHDVSDLKRAELVQRLIAETGEALNASLDYSATLQAVAQMCVPQLADWCVLHVLEDGETLRQIAVAHSDPAKVELALQAQQRYPPNLDAPHGIGQVLRSGQPEFFSNITAEMLAAGARDEEHLKRLKELGMKSVVIVPLVSQGRTLGTLMLIWAESGHSYTQSDVALAQELARRAALAIDNSRLYQESQAHNAELVGRVSQRTYQLQATITKLRSEINERKRVETALRESEKLLETLFESAPDALILVSASGEIQRANAQAEAMFGYTREELLGQTVDILLPVGSRAAHPLHRFSFIREGLTRSMGAGLDLYGLRKDGTEFPIDIMLSPVESPQGILVISAIRDITERKRIEAELAEVQRRLIERVEAERLHLSQELHDGPIQDLYGMTYNLKWLDDRLHGAGELSKEFETVGQGLQSVIATLRNICSELRPPALAAFGLNKAIEGHLEKVKLQHPNLTIEMNLNPCHIALSERQQAALYRIYQSAVSNVLRHSGASRLQVQLVCEAECVNLEIMDNGCGFEVPDRWIELARRGHLGLVGTAERVQAIGGKLKILSAPGNGTQIQVSIPRLSKPEELP
jgi:PAS domain S-box-containing protein